jgi:hypothetical protein
MPRVPPRMSAFLPLSLRSMRAFPVFGQPLTGRALTLPLCEQIAVCLPGRLA